MIFPQKSVFAFSGKEKRDAFTLVEVLLALSISSVIMVGCVALMFDMINIVEHFERGWSLRSHADGIEKFLRLRISTSKISEAPSNGRANSSKTIYLAPDPQSGSSQNDKFICFGIPADHPLLLSQTGFSSGATCYLECGDDGLSLIWTIREEKKTISSEKSIYKTVISPWVKQIGYIYEDDETRWEEEDDPENRSDEFPSAIKLYFKRGDEEFSRVIPFMDFTDFQISN